MENFNEWKDQKLHNPVKDMEEMLERTLNSYGIEMRVVEARKQENSIVFFLSMKLGTKIEELEKRQRELALAVASPTGKIHIQAPIPGRSLVGIEVPYIESSFAQSKQVNEKSAKGRFAQLIGDILLFIAYILSVIGEKLHKVK